MDIIKKQEKTIDLLKTNLTQINFDLTTLSNNISQIDEETISAITLNVNQIKAEITLLQNNLSQINDELPNIDIENLQNQIDEINEKIKKIGFGIKNAVISPDPYKIVKNEYFEPDFSKMLSDYDFLEYDTQILSTTNSANYFQICFAINQNTVGYSKLNLRLKVLNEATDVTFQIYLNGSLWQEKIENVQELNEFKTVEMIENSYLFTQSGNTAVVKIILSNGNSVINIEHFKFELIGKNADILNRLCPVSVMVNDGNYSIFNCLNSTTKTAQFNAENLKKIDELNFSNYTFNANSVNQIKTIETIENNFEFVNTFDLIIGKDLKTQLINETNQTNITLNLPFADIFQTKTTTNYPVKIIATSLSSNLFNRVVLLNYSSQLNSSTLTNLYLVSNLARVVTVKHLTDDYINFDELNAIILTNHFGQNTLFNDCTQSAVGLNLGYGKNVTAYYTSCTSQQEFEVEVYLKIFNKIVKKVCKFSSGTWSVLSSNEIGYYDFYLKGTNGDYFVVKNNKLMFFKYEPEF